MMADCADSNDSSIVVIEQRLRSCGCQGAVVVHDSETATLHAFVQLRDNNIANCSMRSQCDVLQTMLPKDSQLHVLGRLPCDPITGDIQTAVLLQHVRRHILSKRASGKRSGIQRARVSITLGLWLAARAGFRGGLLLPWAMHLAPALLPGDGGLLSHLPGGVALSVCEWVSWYKGLIRYASPAAMSALPYIALLLLDGSSTGLAPFSRFVDGPLGLLGAMIFIACKASPLNRKFLVAAGSLHAKRARGGSAWEWTFWLCFPSLGTDWQGDRWRAFQDVFMETNSLHALHGLQKYMKCRPATELPKLRHCEKCWEWASDGTLWRQAWYCDQCTDCWEHVRKKQADEWEHVEHDSCQNEFLSPQGILHETSAQQGLNGQMQSGVEQANLVHQPAPDLNGQHDLVAEQAVWQGPRVDEIDFNDREVQTAKSQLPANSNIGRFIGESPEPKHIDIRRIGQIVNTSTGLNVVNSQTSLAGLDSLMVVRLASMLRRDLDIDLAASVIFKCGCLFDLERLCAKTEPMKVDMRAFMDLEKSVAPSKWSVYAIPHFWKAPVASLLRLDVMPDQKAMHLACRALVCRHAALRTVPFNQVGDEAMAELCNRAAPLLVALRELFLGTFAKQVCTQAGTQLLNVWPQVIVEPPNFGSTCSDPEAAHFQWLTFECDLDFRKEAWQRARARGFHPPVSVAVSVVSDDPTDACPDPNPIAYLHVAVNHAVCDAACVVPMVTDLLALHDAACALLRATQIDFSPLRVDDILAAAALPPVQSGLAVMQTRLFATLTVDAPEQALDVAHNMYAQSRPGYDHYVRIRPGAYRILEMGAALIGMPQEFVLVTAVAVACCRLASRVLAKLTLVIPMRDSPGDGQVVGNLVTTRHLQVRVHGKSLFEVASDLSQQIRSREWSPFDHLQDDSDGIFMNINGMPRMASGARPIIEEVDTQLGKTRFSKKMVEIAATQEAIDKWALWMGISREFDGNVFACELRSALWNLVMRPLEIVDVFSFPPHTRLSAPQVRWLTLGAPFAKTDAPVQVPAVMFSGGFDDLFEGAELVLRHLLPDFSTDVIHEDDPDWEFYPEVGDALTIVGEESCYTVISSTSRNQRAVGVGPGWRRRENAANLALTFALASCTANFEIICAVHPELAKVCAHVLRRDAHSGVCST